jgi:hypothetical protein
MVPRRTFVLSLAILLGAAVEARAQCPSAGAQVALSRACAGDLASGSASFCFAPETGCSGTGTVAGVSAPDPPFSMIRVHVDGPNGTRVVGDGDFPVVLQQGESIVADLSAVLAAPGGAIGRLAWLVSAAAGVDTRRGETCGVDLVAATPVCAGPSAANPCVGEICVAGACVAGPVAGPCEDGDLCTVGDVCVDGVCQPGVRNDCAAYPCAVGAVCVAGACVGGTPVSCADTNPCTVDACDQVAGCIHVPSDALCQTAGPCMAGSCDAVRGCVQTPLTGPACDDGDACTSGDTCHAGTCRGTAIQCRPDRFECTDERCVAGTCQHVPVDARCGSEECAVGACRPDDAAADRRGCVSAPVGDGAACTDDGLECTDDVCTGGGCLHVPIDSRCQTGDGCQPAACSPDRRDADARGCTLGPAPTGPPAGSGGSGGSPSPGDPGVSDQKPTGDEGNGDEGNQGHADDLAAGAQTCAEDGDPCTDDVCQDTRCVHVQVPEAATCATVKASFRKALGLAALARTLMAAVQNAHAETAQPIASVTTAIGRLGHVEADLHGAVLALSGKATTAAASAPTAGFPETTGQARARIAFTHVLRTPQQIQSFLSVVSEARTRAELGGTTSQTLRRRGRLLLRGTKTLKGDLKRIRQVSHTFAR